MALATSPCSGPCSRTGWAAMARAAQEGGRKEQVRNRTAIKEAQADSSESLKYGALLPAPSTSLDGSPKRWVAVCSPGR